MDFDTNYVIAPDEFRNEAERFVTIAFMLVIFAFFAMTLIVAILVGLLKPQWFRLNIQPDQVPTMADCSCLNVCFPCKSCSFRRCVNACCPRLNLKQRLNCIAMCCNRPGPTRIDLVCCSV
ncbi:unnamed protein product [Caenorhabditis sp. 36 PRJEB53466]|nr:unnamed protein product [Caenorhabditis sp. 36 PRJEB53466]